MSDLEKREVVTESDSINYQRALDFESLGMMGIFPDEKYKHEVDVVFNPEKGAFATLPRGAKVLDLACGRGDTSKLVKDRGYEVTATDSSITAIEKAKDRFRNDGIEFQVGDMKNPPKIKDGYDAITCFGRSLAYFDRYEEYIETLKNWRESLCDNGRIAIEWTEWVNGTGGKKWQSVGGVEVQTDPEFQIIKPGTKEILKYGESVKEEFEYPGDKLPTPIEKRRGGRIYIDQEGKQHDLGGKDTLFVDLLKQRNFPLIKRMIEEAGFKNVRLVEASKPLTPPGQPMECKIFAVTAEKESKEFKVQEIVTEARLRMGLK